MVAALAISRAGGHNSLHFNPGPATSIYRLARSYGVLVLGSRLTLLVPRPGQESTFPFDGGVVRFVAFLRP
jgi:hypothetical protein